MKKITRIIVFVCALIVILTIIAEQKPKPTNPILNSSSSASSNQQLLNICENTPEKQLYQQLLAQEQANPNNANTGNIVSSLATLAPKIQKQQLDCQVKYPTN